MTYADTLAWMPDWAAAVNVATLVGVLVWGVVLIVRKPPR